MYTGTLIDDLMAAVERAEEHVRLAAKEDQTFVLAPALFEMGQAEMGQTEQRMLGAA
jgi:hypothetical protein